MNTKQTIGDKEISSFLSNAMEVGDKVAVHVACFALINQFPDVAKWTLNEHECFLLEQLNLDANQDAARALIASWIDDKR